MKTIDITPKEKPNAERILLAKIIEVSGEEYNSIEEEIQRVTNDPAHRIVIVAMEDYAKLYAQEENSRLLEEKAKLIERVDNAEKRVNFWLTHWNKLDKEFTEFKNSLTSPQ